MHTYPLKMKRPRCCSFLNTAGITGELKFPQEFHDQNLYIELVKCLRLHGLSSLGNILRHHSVVLRCIFRRTMSLIIQSYLNMELYLMHHRVNFISIAILRPLTIVVVSGTFARG